MPSPCRTDENHVSTGWAVKVEVWGTGRTRWEVEEGVVVGEGVGKADGGEEEDSMLTQIMRPTSCKPPVV